MNSTKILCDRFNVRLATLYESGNFVRPASTSFFPFFPFLLSFFFFFTDETEGTCQILPAIRSYVITSSASRSPRFRVRIERFYYDVDYLRSGSNSTDEQRTFTLVAGIFSYWPMKLLTRKSFSFFLSDRNTKEYFHPLKNRYSDLQVEKSSTSSILHMLNLINQISNDL